VLEYMESKGWGSTSYELVKLGKRRPSLKERTRFSPELGYFERLREKARRILERKRASA